jgi:hypothetical protein
LVDEVGHFTLAADGFDGAIASAGSASDADGFVDFVVDEVLADTGTAFLVDDVLDILVPEVVQSGEDGVGRGLSQSAEGCVFDINGKVAQLLQVFHGALALGDLVEHFG